MPRAMRADVAIHGAGPVGCALALLLRRQGRAAVLVQQREAAARSFRPAFRPLALSHASRLILERAGAWRALAVTPIAAIHVSQQRGFGRACMSAADAGVPALGYVLDYGTLLDALLARVREARVPVQSEPVEALLAVHAEGTSEEASRKDYRQQAVVAEVQTRPGATTTAWERFTPEGPLALLPIAGKYGVVWSARPERARELCDADESRFLAALAQAFGRRAGAFVAAGARARLPLSLRLRSERTGERAAYVGNAAQTLHPVAGQGLNLGLRDAWDLAQVLQGAPDPGDARVLQAFAALRRFDATATVRITDFLAGAFLGESPLRGLTRGMGLTALDICLPARRFFARRMIYGASALP
ncbi:MAG: FAD-dependent monooxygenase [Burkholderiales bacterium]|nr:FAD-dependent monooxygenase [Burkholderiales bacterium]